MLGSSGLGSFCFFSEECLSDHVLGCCVFGLVSSSSRSLRTSIVRHLWREFERKKKMPQPGFILLQLDECSSVLPVLLTISLKKQRAPDLWMFTILAPELALKNITRIPERACVPGIAVAPSQQKKTKQKQKHANK